MCIADDGIDFRLNQRRILCVNSMDEAYLKAKAKIQFALLGKHEELDLGHWGQTGVPLKQLPPELRELTILKRLYLRGNELGTLPDWVGELRQLELLDIDDNHLTQVPQCISELGGLKWLSLAHNRLTSLPDWLSDLQHLDSLLLGGNHLLTPLPEWLVNLQRLTMLDLSDNQLLELPTTLGKLGRLENLNVGSNKLTELPEFVLQLTQLSYLDFYENNLETLPPWIGRLSSLKSLNVAGNRLKNLPSTLGRLQQLENLEVDGNQIADFPAFLEDLSNLKTLIIGDPRTGPDGGNPISELPTFIRKLKKLEVLEAISCHLRKLPEWIGEIKTLRRLFLADNQLTDLPPSLASLPELGHLDLGQNPLNPDLAAAYKEGFEAVRRYLRAKAEAQVVLNEAKLILVGEGEVGKSCLLAALRDDAWDPDRPTTHGVEIKPVHVTNPETHTQITLNGWDFGGQRVYRPTHQLFFSAPAVYLVVWKPREGSQQGLVKEWIKLVKHREPDAKILVVATHGGPNQRQPDIDRQEIWDLFGRDLVVDFLLVDSKPDDATHERRGIPELREASARVSANLPEMGRQVPRRWEETRKALRENEAAYLPLENVLKLCKDQGMEEEEARDFVRVSHRLGHLIHYEHDPALRDIVVLKPDWLTAAISFVLDDGETREAHGLVEFSRLGHLWSDPDRPEEFRYDANLHPLFLRLMERFDISYKVAIPTEAQDAIGFWQRAGRLLGVTKHSRDSVSALHYTSLIAQLVPDIRPDPIPGWYAEAAAGDQEQSQICRITETKNGQSAAAEGLFFQLIVRLHKYSLGRLNYADSAHWQRGLVLEDDYGARALLEHVANDVRIAVRSPYPERFLSALTYEVKWLVENFWAGLRCDIMVPCLNADPCTGLFEVSKLIENKKRNRPEQPCPVCNEWQDIEVLLHNAPAARPNPLNELLANSETTIKMLTDVRIQLGQQVGRFDSLEASSRELISKVEAAYTGLMRTLVDEAKEGPRLFSFEAVEPGFFDRPSWISSKFRITLWCEHSRLPLPILNGKKDKRGVYELTMPREWVVRAAPFLKVMAGALSLIAPVAASATKLMLDDVSYKEIEKQLDLSQKSLEFAVKGGQGAGSWLSWADTPDLDQTEVMRAQGAVLRQLHAWLKEQDPSFGGLVRVQNKRQEFLWVHQQFEQEY